MSERKMDDRTLRALIEGVKMGIRPRFAGSIAEWVKAQKVKVTSKQSTTYAGECFDFDLFPATSSLVFGFWEHPTARELIVGKAVQTAFTTSCFWACAWQLAEGDPGNIIYAMHTRNASQNKLKDEVKPIFMGIPALKDGKSEFLDSEAGSTGEALRFAGGTLYVGGGQTPTLLTGTPARIVILDEFEQHGFMGTTSSYALAKGRITGANKGKLVAFSKPEKESEWTQDLKTGRWKTKPRLLALMDAEWVTGDQREFHCPCPHCPEWNSIQWEDIHYDHLDEREPGAKQPMWNWSRFDKEVYWQCPKCKGKVFEGPMKKAMILAGAAAGVDMCWRPAPREQRRQKEAVPIPHPDKWSARVSALTDIAFDSLKWGKLAIRWVNCQGNPTELVSFINEILGKPERLMTIEDTTVEHLKKLIPQADSVDPKGWKYRDEEGRCANLIPLLSTDLAWSPGPDGEPRGGQVAVGMVVDRQRDFLRYGVRAFDYKGRGYLIDEGELSGYEELVEYMENKKFTALDGQACGIDLVWMDLGGDDAQDAYDFCWKYGYGNTPRVEGIRGVGDDSTGRIHRGRDGGLVWANTRKNCPERPVQFCELDSQYFERHLYEHRLQGFNPKRHRSFAPALYFPMDIDEDWLKGLTAMHVVDKPVKKGSFMTRRIYEKKSSAHVNDPGDIEKYFCAMDYVYGGRALSPGLQDGETVVATAEGDRVVRDYVLGNVTS